MLSNSLRWQLVLTFSVRDLQRSHWHMLAPQTHAQVKVLYMHSHIHFFHRPPPPQAPQTFLIYRVERVCVCELCSVFYSPLAHVSVTCHGDVVMLRCVARESTRVREDGWGNEKRRVEMWDLGERGKGDWEREKKKQQWEKMMLDLIYYHSQSLLRQDQLNLDSLSSTWLCKFLCELMQSQSGIRQLLLYH